jgi:esterase/lipase
VLRCDICSQSAFVSVCVWLRPVTHFAQSLLQSNDGGYALTVCGLSLGAGVAALLAIMLKVLSSVCPVCTTSLTLCWVCLSQGSQA